MAYGMGQGGGVAQIPDVPNLGYASWAEMSGIHPGHPLVGGNAGSPGYLNGQRQVITAMADPMAGVAQGSPVRAHWSELGNLKGNPMPWLLMILIGYLALNHIHLNARAGVGGSYR